MLDYKLAHKNPFHNLYAYVTTEYLRITRRYSVISNNVFNMQHTADSFSGSRVPIYLSCPC